MPGAEFLDTDVLVYAYDASSPHKQRVAQRLLSRAVAGEYVISAQVLAEFATTLLDKLEPAPCSEDVVVILNAPAPIPLITPDIGMGRRAVEAQAAHDIHFCDRLIVTAAERGGSGKIWSEDLNAGPTYFGMVVANPFT